MVWVVVVVGEHGGLLLGRDDGGVVVLEGFEVGRTVGIVWVVF